jgi:hypothetical protein
VVRAAALVVGLVATVGSARADDARGFWTGDVDAANHVELTLTAIAFRCESCAEPRWTDFAMADLAGQQHIVDGLAGFAQVSLLYRGETGGFDGEPDWFAGPVTLGLRQRLAVDAPGVTVAVVPSVTIPRAAGGGKASTSVAVAHLLRPDASSYPVKVGTGRLAVEARWRSGRWWLAGTAAAAVHGVEGTERALSARAMGAVGAMVVPDVTAVVEGALTLVRDGASCFGCEDDGQLTRGFVGAGLRGAWGWGTLAAHVGYGLDEDPELTLRTPVTIDVAVGARW